MKNSEGETKVLLSGVGLLTGLVALAAIKALDLPEERIIEPFEPGFSKTFYTFFVDKTKFYRESAIWNEDKKLVEDEVADLIEAGKLPADTTLQVEDKEDPHVLYINFVSGGNLLGCIFTRNSGTEDKNAVYVKGEQSVEEVLVSVGSKLQKLATEKMKNESRVEYQYEQFIMAQLATTPAVEFDVVKAALEAEKSISILDSDLFSVVYGLKKEGRITLEDKTIKLK